MKFVRFLSATLAGIVVVFVLLIATEFVSSILHPFPADFKWTEEEICQHVARYPQPVLGICWGLWLVAAFAGTWVAGRLGGFYPASIVGILLIAAVACNVSKLPYPIWFSTGSLIGIPLVVILATRWSRPRKLPLT